jgi:hypothetical protein
MHAIHHQRPPAGTTVSRRGLLPVLLVAQLMVILDISARSPTGERSSTSTFRSR